MQKFKLIENSIGSLLFLVLIIGMNVFLVKLLWCGIRSILKKPLNLPPSFANWKRMRAEVIQDEEVNVHKVRYYYENEEYTAVIGGFTIYGDKALIYVKRSDPKVVKEFIPKPPMSTSVALSCFFIAGIILIFDYVIFFC